MAWMWNTGRGNTNNNGLKDWADSVAAGLTGNTPTWKIQEDINKSKAESARTQEAVDQRKQATANQNTGQDNDIQYPGYSGGSGSGYSASERAATIGAIDEEIARINNALSNIDGTRRAGLTQLGDQYNKGLTRLNQQHSNALGRYNTKESDTKRDFNKSLEGRGNIHIFINIIYTYIKSYYAEKGGGEGIIHTFTLEEIAICVLVFIVIITLVTLMNNKK